MTAPLTSTTANPMISTYGATSGPTITQQITTGNASLAGNQAFPQKL